MYLIKHRISRSQVFQHACTLLRIAICDARWTRTRCNIYDNSLPISHSPPSQVPAKALPSTIISDMQWEPRPDALLSMIYFHVTFDPYRIPL